MQISTVCNVCGKEYKKNSNVNAGLAEAIGRDLKNICYACALESLTKGSCPEEGDFNSAHLISGEISDKELRWLMEDLQAVEEGRSIREPYDYTDEEQMEPWCDICGTECWCNCCEVCGYKHPCLCEEED